MNASGPVGLGRFLIGVLARKADSNASSYPSLTPPSWRPRASVHDSNVYGKLAKGDKNEVKCAQPA